MDRITQVCIKNARAIEYVELDLSRPLTVLIGENGSGKSTILECLELLRKASDASFMDQLYQQHRGLAGLLRKGAPALELGVIIEDDSGTLPRIAYRFSIEPRGAGAVIASELLLVGPIGEAAEPWVALRRSRDGAELFNQQEARLVPIPNEAMRPDRLVIASFGNLPPHKAIERLLTVLRSIEIQLPFDTVASWAASAYQLPRGMRSSVTLRPAERLDLLGYNLANAWNELKNGASEDWQAALDLVRLGLGDHIDNVQLRADPGGGSVALSLRIKGLHDPVPAADLSDGQLSWLAFVAMAHLNVNRSLLAVDEPELHLHPSLLGRVISLLSTLPGGAPVILSTHSDRVLEMLEEPAEAIRVCALEGSRAVVSRVDATELPRWLDEFGDIGQLRAAGYLPRVLIPLPTAGDHRSEGE